MKLLIAAMMVANVALASSPRVDESRLFVKIKNSLPQHNLIQKTKHLFGKYYLIETSQASKLAKAIKDQVELTELNYYAGKNKLPEPEVQKNFENVDNFTAFNDPRANRVWSFRDGVDNGVSVNRSYLAPLGLEKEEIIVAVVDTGVDYNHEDLKGNMWINPGEIAGNGIDDDQNGYIDDVHGINTLDREGGVATGDPMDTHSHGTHVAGTIGAIQNNNTGIAGIASQVKIMAIRTVPNRGDETDADVVESFLYAAKNGARLINCSFGKKHNEGGLVVNETMNHIGQTYGTLVVAAAGNDSSNNDRRPKYPASFDSDYLLVVASTSSSGRMSYFSNYGKTTVDIAAPGSGIYSTVPGNRYRSMSGTSMACPTTVGVAAEVWSHFPELGALELKQALMDSVTPVGRFEDRMVSEGRVDLYQALQSLL